MTYNGRPCEMLCKEHILLLLCIRHIVQRSLMLCGNSARSSRAVATRLGRVYLRLRYHWTAVISASHQRSQAIPLLTIDLIPPKHSNLSPRSHRQIEMDIGIGQKTGNAVLNEMHVAEPLLAHKHHPGRKWTLFFHCVKLSSRHNTRYSFKHFSLEN
jgi:hypothetical protein